MTVPSASDAVAIRASDREREQHIDVLRRHAGDGRLTFEELEQRIESAYAARTQEELAAVLAGCPLSPTPTFSRDSSPPSDTASTSRSSRRTSG